MLNLDLPINRRALLLAPGILGSSAALGAPEEKHTYYVQLIRGSGEHRPPEAGAKAIGPKLSKS